MLDSSSKLKGASGTMFKKLALAAVLAFVASSALASFKAEPIVTDGDPLPCIGPRCKAAVKKQTADVKRELK
jgi:hypothetical protein